MANRGSFVGKLRGFRNKDLVTESKNNSDCLILNALVDDGNNAQIISMIGTKQKSFKVKNNDKKKINVAWEDRFDEDILKEIPMWYKTRVVIGDEDKEFLSTYDALKYLEDNYDDFKNDIIKVNVDFEKNPYDGKVTDRYRVRSIFPQGKNDTPKLRLKLDFYWNKDSIDDTEWADNKILYIHGYIESYDSKAKENFLFPQTLVLNCSKVDFDNEKQKAQVDFRLKYLKTKSRKYRKCAIDCAVIRGAEETDELTYDDLTDKQKEMVDLELKTVEDFKDGRSYVGDFKSEIRFINFDFKDDYADGPIEVDETDSEFEDRIWHESNNETKKTTKKKTEEDDDDGFTDAPDDLEDLFV